MNSYEINDTEPDFIDKMTQRVEKVIKGREKGEPIKNSMAEDFSKGSVRNQKCPMCSKKLKKCGCFDITNDSGIADLN